MALNQVQIGVADLTLGMFVSRLDRPWKNTPFPLQGFHVRSGEDVASLKAYCNYVFIDTTKGRGLLGEYEVLAAGSNKSGSVHAISGVKPAPKKINRMAKVVDEGPPIEVRTGVYGKTLPVHEEVKRAKAIVRDLRGSLSVVSRQLAQGKLEDYESFKADIDGMVDSVLRCPDAFTWLIRLRDKDKHIHDHSLRSALWATQFARHIGMDKQEISVLCLGTVLKDIGKTKVSNVLLRKQNRSADEEQEYRKFVAYGVEMLRNTNKIEPRVISVVRYHAEQHNGQGFPEKLSGVKIPLLARIAGIATAYDGLSNPREASQKTTPSEAISLL